MNPIRHIRRYAAVVAGLARRRSAGHARVRQDGARSRGRIPGTRSDGLCPGLSPGPVQVRTIVAGGMPGWQIALIAVGAALLAAALAVLADRALAARRRAVTTAA